MTNNKYFQQVELLLEILPLLNQSPYFALKGSTAINSFVRDMPRLSIDIDLCYLLIESRQTFLNNVTQAINKLAEKIEQHCHAFVKKQYTKDKQLSKLLVSKNDADIKIEPNLVLRGSVYGSEQKTLCKSAQNRFLQSFKVNMLSPADLYAGKICAALDRQHPRDLFDIKVLLDNEGITAEIRSAFVVYLASSPRSMHELLNPNLIDIRMLFDGEFSGMTVLPINYDELIDTRRRLIEIIHKELTIEEKQFLLSIKQGEPQWDLLNLPSIEKLPALQWKVLNVRKMEKSKHQQLVFKLKKTLQLD